MKAKGFIPLVLALMFIFIFYGMVLGEGGPGPTPPGCQNLPDPKTSKGPIIHGFLTAATDLSGNHWDVQIVLEGKIQADTPKTKQKVKIRHLLYTTIGPVKAPDICDRTDADLIRDYKDLPCALRVGEPFGLKGTPVLTEFSVKTKEFCGDSTGNRMIYATFKVVVVPEK
jgi:hypothetical protein